MRLDEWLARLARGADGEGGSGGGESGSGGGEGGSGGGEGGSGGGEGGSGGGSFQDPDAWRSGVRDEKALGYLKARGFESAEALALAAMRSEEVANGNLEGRVKVPGDDATDEERVAFREAIGVPKEAAAYDFKAAEGTPPEVLTAFKDMLFEADVPAKSAQMLAERYLAMEAQVVQQREAAEEADLQQTVAELKRELGGRYDEELAAGKRATQLMLQDAGVGLEGLDDLETALGSKAAVVKLMMSIGRRLGEAKPAGLGETGEGADDAFSAQQKIDAVLSDPKHELAVRLNARDRTVKERAQQEWENLHKRAAKVTAAA